MGILALEQVVISWHSVMTGHRWVVLPVMALLLDVVHQDGRGGRATAPLVRLLIFDHHVRRTYFASAMRSCRHRRRVDHLHRVLRLAAIAYLL